MSARPRVIIADDHALFAAGLRHLLLEDCEVLSTATTSEVLLTDVQRLMPDLILQDLSMASVSGIELVRRVREVHPLIRVIIVTMHADPVLAAEAFRAGASGYVLKNCAAGELLEAIRNAMERKTYITPLIASDTVAILAGMQSDTTRQLSERQRQVLRLLAEGKSMKEVADALNVAVKTIAYHKYRMMEDLQIRSTAELIRFAVVQGIV